MALPPDPEHLIEEIRRHRGRFTRLGVILIALGLLAVLFPLVASIAAKVMFGAFVLISGAVVLWHAFQVRRGTGGRPCGPVWSACCNWRPGSG